MIRFRINEAKGLFFDAPAVLRAVDRATRRVFGRFGAITRGVARRSMRRRRRSAAAGQPPSAHQGLIKRFLFFVFDPAARSVVIGPAKIDSPAYDDALDVLEHGGQAVRVINGRRLRVHYAPHPFMGPAFDKTTPRLPDLWRDQVN